MVYLNGIPFRVDLDATPPEIAWSHGPVVAGGQQLTVSFDEVHDTSGCLYASVPVDDILVPGRWHIVDPNLELWTVGAFSGTDQVFVPVAGEYLPDGTPVVKREDGRPVDVARAFARSMYSPLFARDRAGNTSTL